MKVVHVINSLGIGGAERQLTRVSEAARCSGIDQSILTLSSLGNQFVPNGVPVIEPGAGWAGYLTALRNLRRALRANSVVVAWMYHSWLAVSIAKLLAPGGAGVVFYCRHADLATLKPSTKIVAISGLLVARLLHIPVMFNSSEAMISHQRWLGNGRAVVIPNLVTLPVQSIRSRRLRMGYLGRNHKDKGADRLPLLLSSLKERFPAWTFSVSGPGMLAMEPELRKAFSCWPQADLTVQDTVWDTASLLDSLDILIVPSRTESFPNVLIEALGAGLPVAAMNVGEIDRILGGVLPSAESVEELIEIAARIASLDSDEWCRLGRRLRDAVAARYSVGAVMPMHLDLWRQVGHG